MSSIQQITPATDASNAAASVAGALARPRAAAATSSTGNASKTATAASSNTASITANDFLTLLVAEMKN